MPVATIFENLEDGMTIEELMEQFDVTREQVKAVLEFAARSLDTPPSSVTPANRCASFLTTEPPRGLSTFPNAKRAPRRGERRYRDTVRTSCSYLPEVAVNRISSRFPRRGL